MADRDQLVHVLVEFARRATGTPRTDALLRDLAAAAARVLDVDGAGVACRDGERLTLVHATDDVVGEVELAQDALQQGPCQEAAALQGVVVEEDLASSPRRWPDLSAHALRLGLHAVASVPLLAREQVWGALDLYRRAPGPFDPTDLAAAQALADIACSYVVMAFDHELARSAQREADHAATHDALTGLPNRALLHDRLEHAVATAHRNGTPLALLFLDLDGFKAVNDAHGHLAGDQLLVQIASRLRGVLRRGDTLARLGGDEFVVICEGLHRTGGDVRQQVEGMVERVRGAVSQPVTVGGHTVVPAVSIGVATIDDPPHGIDVTGLRAGEDAQRLLQAADHAMYRAKNHAKNRAGDPARVDQVSGARARTPGSPPSSPAPHAPLEAALVPRHATLPTHPGGWRP
jgi:diguanylate cyclase (GGDEF)-like protein